MSTLKTEKAFSLLSDEVMERFEAEFDFYLRNRIQRDPDRLETAEHMVACSRSLIKSHDPEIMQARERLCKMACLLDPHNKTYWTAWARELAWHDDEKRDELICETQEMMEILTPHQRAVEYRAPFHSLGIGQNVIIDTSNDIWRGRGRTDSGEAKKTVVRRKAPDAISRLVGEGQDIFDAADALVEKLPTMSEEARKLYGQALVREIPDHTEEVEPIAVATLYVTAALIAENSNDCFAQARRYIDDKLKTSGELQEIMETVGVMNQQSSVNSLFRDNADKLLDKLSRKFAKRVVQTGDYHPAG